MGIFHVPKLMKGKGFPDDLTEGLHQGHKRQTLLGATGTGKTYVMAQIIEQETLRDEYQRLQGARAKVEAAKPKNAQEQRFCAATNCFVSSASGSSRYRYGSATTYLPWYVSR